MILIAICLAILVAEACSAAIISVPRIGDIMNSVRRDASSAADEISNKDEIKNLLNEFDFGPYTPKIKLPVIKVKKTGETKAETTEISKIEEFEKSEETVLFVEHAESIEPETDLEYEKPNENETVELTEEDPSEHECCTWINESEFEDGLHVWECEECGETEFWEWFDEDEEPEDHKCTEFTQIDEEGYYYCLECGAGYFEE